MSRRQRESAWINVGFLSSINRYFIVYYHTDWCLFFNLQLLMQCNFRINLDALTYIEQKRD